MAQSIFAVSAPQEAIRAAWHTFVSGEPLLGAPVAPHILTGWEKSRKYGVDPLRAQVPPVLGQKELEELCEANKALLQSAEPMLRMLEVSIRETGYIATLAVASGHLLAVVGDDTLMEQARAQYNIPGAERSLKTVGASALSLSISERRPVQVTGFEHYNRFFHEWRCTAAPIFDAGEKPIGSLTISSHISRPDMHTLTLAQSCADCISIRLREHALMESQRHLNAMLESVHNSLPEAVVAINPAGVVTHANQKAVALFSQIAQNVVGAHLEGLFSRPEMPRILQLVGRGQRETLELEVLSAKGPTNRMCRFEPIRLDNGTTCGMTLSISTKSQVIDIAKHVGGNYAKYCFDDIKGESPLLKGQIELARRAAASAHRVLLYGESGTGKELFAQSIHNCSKHHNGPFVAISCAAIPRDLIESELFGYVGGAFTGARRNGMVGKMELATGGTLFLDEVNSLPLEMQAKLLRVLQQMEIVRLGDTKPTPIDARVIAATNQDLREAVHQGTFREDLYFRLNVVEITIPPLRERNEDIGLLAHQFFRRQSLETSVPFPHVGADALDALYRYSWPGNVRELDNVCERALLMAGGAAITLAHLPPHIVGAATAIPCASPTSTGGIGGTAGGGRRATAFGGVATGVDDAYRRVVQEAMAMCNNNISMAAEHLGIARTTLYRKLKKYGLEG
ncbi:sigma-54-dependent Fis family transcriptional regulator [Desulfovibrio cuneatus]|uniref:sigma-54-dependent Fis family transcriptional regulator n=1 Tax=Desulfovibrio cuneatus TaxID=159728 RepID=UPI0003F9FC5A|nr:sigma-54-dependent Fis family transcriptional regulator [Desulfovibrio cuneatus]